MRIVVFYWEYLNRLCRFPTKKYHQSLFQSITNNYLDTHARFLFWAAQLISSSETKCKSLKDRQLRDSDR